MKKNTLGFSAVGVVIIISVLVLTSTLGWFVYKNQNKTSSNSPSTNKAEVKAPAATEVAKIDTAIYDVDLKLIKSSSDVAQLPSTTPASFSAYLSSLLSSNQPYMNGGVSLTNAYSFTKISSVNIAGGKYSIDSNNEVYPGGAPLIWALTPTGVWEFVSADAKSCTTENGGKIYKEFADKCNSNGGLVDNPNGSITTINQ